MRAHQAVEKGFPTGRHPRRRPVQSIDKPMGVADGETMWGAAPRPGRGGTPPLHPIFGASPQEGYSFYRHSALALGSHLGLRPKPRASSLARSLLLLEMKLRRRGNSLRCLTGFFDKLKGCGTYAAALSFAIYSSLVCVQAPCVGFWGVAPNGNPEPKQNGDNKLYIPWGFAPITGCRGLSPLPGFGVEPQRPKELFRRPDALPS